MTPPRTVSAAVLSPRPPHVGWNHLGCSDTCRPPRDADSFLGGHLGYTALQISLGDSQVPLGPSGSAKHRWLGPTPRASDSAGLSGA